MALKFGDHASINERDQAIKGSGIQRMRASFGAGPVGEKCQDCIHLTTGVSAWGPKINFGCALYWHTMGVNLKWNPDWTACGKFSGKTLK